MTACHKENIEPIIDNEIPTAVTTKTKVLDLSNLDNPLKSNARADFSVIMNEVIEMTSDGFYDIHFEVADLPNPATHRIEVSVIPLEQPINAVFLRAVNDEETERRRR